MPIDFACNLTQPLNKKAYSLPTSFVEIYFKMAKVCCFFILQDAQLSQRNRAAGCVIVFAKSRRLELGDNILRTL